jgi:hypothetical protein
LAGVFISYRRIDSAGESGRLYEALVRRFGREGVFMDVEGGISRGDDFPSRLDAALQSANALVAVIGREWLRCTNEDGGRRLEKENDWVRKEIASALTRGILVIPVLVDGGQMPNADQLPVEIARLVRKQAAELRHTSWDYDVAQLAKVLRAVVPWSMRQRVLALLVATAGIVAGVVALGSRRPEVFLEKVSGEGQAIPAGEYRNFAVVAKDRAGRPLPGAKVAWETPECGASVFIRTAADGGFADATNMCNGLSVGKHTQIATPADDAVQGMWSQKDKVRPIGDPVSFSFDVVTPRPLETSGGAGSRSDTDASSTPSDPPQPKVDCRTSVHLGRTFLACSGTEGWEGSRNYCLAHGGDLVVIDNSEENNYVSSLVRSVAGRGYIGLRQNAAGAFQWVNGEKLTFAKWYPGEPSHIGMFGELEQCVELVAAEGLWNDVACVGYGRNAFVCEGKSLGVETEN